MSGEQATGEDGPRAAVPIPTWYFATVVVRRGERFVLVRETGDEELWGLPGGRLEAGETFAQAARRETREEAGIDVTLEGILGFEHTPMAEAWSRVGIALQAVAADDRPLKSQPDAESHGADWFGLEDLDRLPLRGPRVARLVRFALSEPGLIPLDRIEDFRFGV